MVYVLYLLLIILLILFSHRKHTMSEHKSDLPNVTERGCGDVVTGMSNQCKKYGIPIPVTPKGRRLSAKVS